MAGTAEREGPNPTVLASAEVHQLIAAVQAGDEAAQRRLVSEAMDFVQPVVISMLHQSRARGGYLTETLVVGSGQAHIVEEDAWGITHSTCCAMLTHLDSFKGRGLLGRRVRFTTWLYAIARNQVRSVLRKRWRERRRRTDLDDSTVEGDGFDPAELPDPSGASSPEAVWEEKERRDLVHEGLEKAPLTPEQREAVTLFYALSYRQDQIAEMTGVQVGTVKKRIFDGIRKLRAYVEADDDETRQGG